MSRLSDYSRFDHLDDEDDGSSDGGGTSDAASARGPASSRPASGGAVSQPAAPAMTTRKNADGRYVFECDGRKIYEWEQSLDEVSMYVDAPPGIKADQLSVTIRTDRLRIGLKGADRYFIDEATYGKVKPAESSWYLDDSGIISIVLAKVYRGETWEAALGGAQRSDPTLQAASQEQIRKDLMLERFQEENPGFDFRGAEFNGAVPDPRTFMGGIGYK